MPEHTIGTAEEWRQARLDLLQQEKELVHQSDAVAAQRQALPWVRVEKDHRFDSEDGEVTLADLFRGRSQLLLQHFMFVPDWDEGCPSCSAMADGWNGTRVHLENHDVAMVAVSRAPIEKLVAYRERMGWDFPWVSSGDRDFNFDFGVSFREDQLVAGTEHNYRALQMDAATLPHGGEGSEPVDAGESPGVSAFVLDDGVVYHTYSTYQRGLDGLWGMYQWLDRAPLGRNEDGMWFRRHDQYEA
jgi:predicted dithiol-disulfide oxidoreductase (DUF899 family)